MPHRSLPTAPVLPRPREDLRRQPVRRGRVPQRRLHGGGPVGGLIGPPAPGHSGRGMGGGGGSAYGGSRGMGGPREFFTATCSNCGGEARVPFQPRGDKPVYCSSCFEQVRPSASRGARY